MPDQKDDAELQKVAEADVQRFREALGPFVVAAETTRMAMVFTNAEQPSRPIVFANDSFLKLTGYSRADVLGQSFNSLMERGAPPETLAQLEAAFEGSSGGEPEIFYKRKDGSDFWASLFISPVTDRAGHVTQHFVSLVDLTRQRREHVQARMLIDELNHRVKNTLATVQSITSQALRSSSNLEEIREAIESRLFALSRSHDLLTRENWDSAGLHDVVDAALEPFGIADGLAERFTISGENIRFPPSAALALGIAFHELATNAVKYGAFANNVGSVLVEWTVDSAPDGDRLLLYWRERDGPPASPPLRKGFGSRVIERGLAHELQGTVRLDFQEDGVTCTIDVPMPARAADG